MRHDLLSHGSSAPLGLLDLGLAVGKILGVDSENLLIKYRFILLKLDQ